MRLYQAIYDAYLAGKNGVIDLKAPLYQLEYSR
jgi:hypothetical protein